MVFEFTLLSDCRYAHWYILHEQKQRDMLAHLMVFLIVMFYPSFGKNDDNGLQLSLVNYQMKKEVFRERHKQLKLDVEQIL